MLFSQAKLSDIRRAKKVYIINSKFLNVNSIKYFNKLENNSIKLLLPNCKIDLPADTNDVSKILTFDWSIFEKKYYLRWISHSRSFKKILKYKSKSIINYLARFFYGDMVDLFFKKKLLQSIQEEIELEEIKKNLKNLNRHVEIIKIKNFNIKNIFYDFVKFFFFIPFVIIKSKKVFFLKKKLFKLGLRYYSSGLNFSINDKRVDWIVDKNKLTKRDIVIIADENLDKDQEEIIKNSNYEYINLNLKNPNNLYVDFLHIFFYLVIFLLQNIFFLAPYFFLSSKQKNNLYKIFSNLIKWNLFCDNFNIRNFLTYHDYSSSSILRNIILKKRKCNTVHYKHTNSETVYDKKNFHLYNNTLFAYHYYDYENHWTEESANMSKKDLSKSSNVIISGPVWSILGKSAKKKKKKIISFFTTSINKIGCVNSRLDHIYYLDFLI